MIDCTTTNSAPDGILEDLIRDEGEVLHVYFDSGGYATIGVGRMIDPRRGGGISIEESRYLLANDITRFAARLDEKLPWWRTLDVIRQRVLLNMAFNLGVAGLLRFRRTLAAIETGDWERASRQMLSSLWARQVGRRARRLAEMMRTGEDVALSEVR